MYASGPAVKSSSALQLSLPPRPGPAGLQVLLLKCAQLVNYLHGDSVLVTRDRRRMRISNTKRWVGGTLHGQWPVPRRVPSARAPRRCRRSTNLHMSGRSSCQGPGGGECWVWRAAAAAWSTTVYWCVGVCDSNAAPSRDWNSGCHRITFMITRYSVY